MKKLIFAFIAMSTMVMEAQNITDAVRYSTSDLTGTARFRAMSGAFGALGGDLSSLNVNPAGSAVFLRSSSSFTLDMSNFENEVSYFNGFTSNSNSNFDLGQAGAVFVFNNMNENSGWRKFTLGFNFGKTADFENNFMAAGINPNNSIADYFLDYAQGVPLDLLRPTGGETPSSWYSRLGETQGFGVQQAFLGYDAFVIEAESEDPDNVNYYSNVAPGSYDQEYSYAATGMNGKMTFNFATQFEDNLYLGFNINSHFLNYERVTIVDELNENGGDISSIYFEDRLSTVGSGFSFQLGALAKLGELVRLGASYESPTWYSISEESTQYLETNRAIIEPNIINIYPDYTLQTPGKYTGSAALVFGGSGLLSFDYSFRDYSSTRFRPTGDAGFSYQNNLMEDALIGASTYRVGGEYRISRLSLRGGYRFEESPYRDETLGDLTGYSFGLGVNLGGVKLDLAYDTADQESNPQLFETGLTDRAYIDRSISNYTLTLSFGL